MAVHMFEALILLFMVESCIANVETIEFRIGDRKLRVPLNNPAIVELNEDGNLEDIRIIPDQDEINKQAFIPPKQTIVSSTPQRRLLEPERRMPIQRTLEDYRHPSQPNNYEYYPTGNQEYLPPQRRPINHYPDAQFPRYPQDKQLLHQHFSAPHLHPKQYSQQMQPQPRYPNGYRNPYQPPPHDARQESHVHNRQRALPYYPNYDYHDPYYDNNFPRSRPQENYVPNPYLTKNIDFNRRNPNTYYPQELDQYDTREFPGTGPQDSKITRIEPDHETIYSQSSPRNLPITRKEDNLPKMLPDFQKRKQTLKIPQSLEVKSQSYKSPPVPSPAVQDKSRRPPPAEAQKYKQAYKYPQSFEDKPQQHKSPSIPKRTLPGVLQDKSRQSTPHLVENFESLHLTPKPESVQRPIHRKPDNILKSHEFTHKIETLSRRPGIAEQKPIAISKNYEKFSTRAPITPEILFTTRLPLLIKEQKLPPSSVIEDKPYKSILESIRTTSTNFYPEYYSPTTKTEYPDISSSLLKTTTNAPDFSQLIQFTDTHTVKEPPIDDTFVRSYSIQNVTKVKTETFAQSINATETVSNESDVPNIIADDPPRFKSLEKNISNVPQKPIEPNTNTDSSVYNENVTTYSTIATDFRIEDNSSKHFMLENSESSLITNLNKEADVETSSVLNSEIQTETSPEQNPKHNPKISSLDSFATTKEPVEIKTVGHPVKTKVIEKPEFSLLLETTTNNPVTSWTAMNEFNENTVNKISTNDTSATIEEFSNDQKDVYSDIQQTTTDSPLVNTETESPVLFITKKKSVQTTTIKPQTTVLMNSNGGSNTHEIPLSVHYIRIDAPEKNKDTESTDASSISSLSQETERSNPEVKESILKVVILENTNINHTQNKAEKYSPVDHIIMTTQPNTNIATDSSVNYVTTDEIATLAPDEDTQFNKDTSSSSTHATVHDRNSSFDVTESERRMQSSPTETQSSLQIVLNSTETKDTVTTKSKTRRRPCKHKKTHGQKHGNSGRRRRRRRRPTTVPATTLITSSLTTQDNIM